MIIGITKITDEESVIISSHQSCIVTTSGVEQNLADGHRLQLRESLISIYISITQSPKHFWTK